MAAVAKELAGRIPAPFDMAVLRKGIDVPSPAQVLAWAMCGA